MSAPAVNSLNPAIEVSGLSAGYDGLVLLKDVTFSVAPGEIFFVIGGSGCGKTTLLRNMIGLRTPLAGEVRFNGRPFSRADRIERRKILRTFGMLFQSGALWSSLPSKSTPTSIAGRSSSWRPSSSPRLALPATRITFRPKSAVA